MMLFADGIQVVISVVVLIIGFIGWLMQIAGQQNQPKQQARRPRPPRPNAGGPQAGGGDRLRDEIEVFLNEVSDRPDGGPKERPARPRPAAFNDEIAIEVIEEEPTPRPAPKRKPGRPAEKREHLHSELEDRHLKKMERSEFDDVKRHVGEYMPHSESSRAESAFGDQPMTGVRKETFRSSLAPQTSADIRAVFEDPTRVREAIVVSEILQKPRVLRR
ncbi:hypothetical protein [Stratiformator vulcanicus]|uniref:Uncharacterized protein n=1 Tax=Stratiformator vulcanicus TaxID=2527980 RepID=A0A517R5H8_9PLAN|nr:hypothetical protein [Stratiformator vulcanicus]QDT39132.1 hypothetical protein Pan189_35350 [Stratiformator vulcanicus]